jgi:DNA-binding beta-propeller fold protein YncE
VCVPGNNFANLAAQLAARLCYISTCPALVSSACTACADNTINRVAGNTSTTDTTDGSPALEFALRAPYGFAFDSAGNTLVSDAGAHKIYKIDKISGVITTLAGAGNAFLELLPQETIVSGSDSNRRLLAAPKLPSLQEWLRRGWQQDGHVTARDGIAGAQSVHAKQVRAAEAAGSADYAAILGEDVPALEANFMSPARMVVDAAGDVFVTDPFAHVVRKISASTGRVTTYAGVLEADQSGGGFEGDAGPATSARLKLPLGLALHPHTGDLYIGDSNNCRCVVNFGRHAYAVPINGRWQPSNSTIVERPCTVVRCLGCEAYA